MMLNQLYNWILRELVFLWVIVVPTLSSYTLLAWVIRVKLTLKFTFLHKGILVIT